MIGSALLDRGGAALDRPARLAAAVDRLPGSWGRTVRSRLEVLAEALVPGTPPPTGARLAVVLAGLGAQDPARQWLALAVLTAELPLVTDVQRLQRAVSLDGPAAALRPLLLAAGWREAVARTAAPRVEVRAGVLVDVSHTARTGLATGIQRVTREVARRWDAAHDVLLVGWADGLRALRPLDPAERRQALTGTGGALRDGEERTAGTVVVPWHGTYLLPELAPERERTLRLMALARFSGCATGTIGYDCVPISSAETTDHGVSESFAGSLAAVRHFDRVATISGAAAQEYLGWRHMLTAIGVPGPHVQAVPLPTERVVPGEQDLARARARFLVGDLPLLLCVGTHEPRKNHLALLHAAETAWRAGHRFSLSFIGGHSWSSDRFDARLAALQEAGRPVDDHRGVDDGELWGAYAVARAVVFPSLHEGYGLPVAEALAVGTPVVTSAYGSMAEIAEGGGAVLVDPRDDAAIAAALAAVVDDPATVSRLRAEAAARPRQTWDDYAERVWCLLTGAAPQATDDGRPT